MSAIDWQYWYFRQSLTVSIRVYHSGKFWFIPTSTCSLGVSDKSVRCCKQTTYVSIDASKKQELSCSVTGPHQRIFTTNLDHRRPRLRHCSVEHQPHAVSSTPKNPTQRHAIPSRSTRKRPEVSAKPVRRRRNCSAAVSGLSPHHFANGSRQCSRRDNEAPEARLEVSPARARGALAR